VCNGDGGKVEGGFAQTEKKAIPNISKEEWEDATWGLRKSRSHDSVPRGGAFLKECGGIQLLEKREIHQGVP